MVYEKNFGQRIGTKGEEKLRVEVDPVKNKIILLSDKSISSKETFRLLSDSNGFFEGELVVVGVCIYIYERASHPRSSERIWSAKLYSRGV